MDFKNRTGYCEGCLTDSLSCSLNNCLQREIKNCVYKKIKEYSDEYLLDWLEDYPKEAVEIMIKARDSNTHDLRGHINRKIAAMRFASIKQTILAKPLLTKHSGDCSIYSALINGYPTDGICTCGYGAQQLAMGDVSCMFSDEFKAERGVRTGEPNNGKLER